MRPVAITEVSIDESPNGNTVSSAHPLAMPVLVLSDLCQLYEKPTGSQPAQSKTTNNHITLKLRFYANHILSTPQQILWALAGELGTEAGRYKQQASRDLETQGKVRRPAGPKVHVVEEVEIPDQS